jgi:hypothetical protein
MQSAFRFTLLFFLGLVTLPGCANENESADKLREAKEQEEQKLISSMAVKHDAVRGWEDNLASGLTLPIQDALLRSDGRPVVVEVFLVDLFRHKTHYYVVFDSDLDSVACPLRWNLECNSDVAAQLLANKAEFYTSLWIVVQVSEVDKALIKAGAEENEYDMDRADWGSVETDDTILISGKLIAFLITNGPGGTSTYDEMK